MLTLWSSHTSTSLLHSQINHFLQTNLRRGHGSQQQPSHYYHRQHRHQATADQQPPQPLPPSPAQGISHHEEVIDEATELLNSDLKDRVARIAAHEAHVPLRDIEQVYVSEVADDHIHLQMMTCDVDTNQCVAIEKDVVFDHPCCEGADDELECIMENIAALAATWTESEDETLASSRAAETVQEATMDVAIDRILEVINGGNFASELVEVLCAHLNPATLARLASSCPNALDRRMSAVSGDGGDADPCNVTSLFTDSIEMTSLTPEGFSLSARVGAEEVSVLVSFGSRCMQPADLQANIMEEVQGAYNRNRGRR